MENIRIKSYTSLFDRTADGLKFHLAIAFLVALLLTRLVSYLIFIIRSDLVFFLQPTQYLVMFAFDVLQAAILLGLSYMLSRDWHLPLFWGLVIATYGMSIRWTIYAISPEGIYPGIPFNPYSFAMEYSRGFVFMAGFMLTVRIAALRPGWFILGITLAHLIGNLTSAIPFLFASRNHSVYPNLTQILSFIISGAVFGVLLYIGLVSQIQRKKISKTAVFLGLSLPCGILLLLSVVTGEQTRTMLQESADHARELANRVQCMKHLQKIHSGVKGYQIDHKRYPESLAELVKANYLSEDMLICPSTGQPAGKIDYVYCGKGLNLNVSAVCILAYDQPPNHQNKVFHVLFVDGHVKTLTAQKFQTAIEDNNHYRKKLNLPLLPELDAE